MLKNISKSGIYEVIYGGFNEKRRNNVIYNRKLIWALISFYAAL